MRALVVSDLHSNAEALRVVMNRVRRKKFDQVICLGDFVGYGAQPNQVLDTMRTMKAPKLYIRGNHDRVAAGLDDAEGFNTRREGRRALDARSPLRAATAISSPSSRSAPSSAKASCSVTARRTTRTSTFSTKATPATFSPPPKRRSSSTATRTCR